MRIPQRAEIMAHSKRETRQKPILAGNMLPEDFVLVVSSNRGLEGFSSSDEREDLMREFFKELEFKYRKPFVCASAQAPAPASGTRKKSKSQTVDAYGQPYVLKPELLDRAVMACAGDFKNVMSKAFIDYAQNGTPLKDYKKYFRQLAGLTLAEKRNSILDAHKFLVEGGNMFGTYVEVRLQGLAKAKWSDKAIDELGAWLASMPDDEELE
jgi:hypothetical protein